MSSSLLPLATTFPSTNPRTISHRAIKTRTNQTQRFRSVSCNHTPDDKNHNHNDNHLILPQPQKLHVLPNIDRRNVLVRLGGLYSTASLASLPTALADPIQVSDDIFLKCKQADPENVEPKCFVRTTTCCPPSRPGPGKKINPFVFPDNNEPVRMRWPAHAGTDKQIMSYRKAIQAMRDLPPNHPHSLSSQAKIHCAYCDGAYTDQTGKKIEIHGSWLFFPFHRWYLYFYERILRKYSEDATFALPFWKWDDNHGMKFPEIFLPQQIDGKPNPLAYDVYRDTKHSYGSRLVDLDYYGKDKDERSDEEQIECNYKTVYRELVRNGADTLSFFGGRYIVEKDDSGPKTVKSGGSVEAGTHTAVHRWVGNRDLKNKEDMGQFYSAGYDPLFYVHHANVDRMWKLWKQLQKGERGRGCTEPNERDWLDASYVFYDENEELVRVTNEQSVDIDKLKYNYISDKVFPKWVNSRLTKPTETSRDESIGPDQTVELKCPLSLDKTVKVRVKRLDEAVNMKPEERAKTKEVLVIEGIMFDCDNFVRFDVFVNDKRKLDAVRTSCDPTYAGLFAQIEHGKYKDKDISSMPLIRREARFVINELLEDTKTVSEPYVTVTLVPRVGCEKLTICEITFDLRKLLL